MLTSHESSGAPLESAKATHYLICIFFRDKNLPSKKTKELLLCKKNPANDSIL